MNCHEVKGQLAAYSEGQLPLAESGSVERHLQGCASCSRDLARMRKVWPALQVMTPVEPPAGVALRVMGRIRSQRRLVRFIIPMAAAAVLLLAVTFLILFPGSPQDEGSLAREDAEMIQNMDLLMVLDEAEIADLIEDDAALAQLEKVLDLEEPR